MSALKICPQCGTEYELDQRFCPKDGSTLRSQSNPSGDLLGQIIADRYHVMKKLGEGGMGTVYLAEHVKMGRKSAVKVMNPDMVNDADAISRFNREAANASRINHPNVAAVYDFGETTEGMIYLAMEFIEGPSLTHVIEELGALPALRAADITRQASEALAIAHDMGIVHRDLKPDNIMLAKGRDGQDIVKVVDFGIAKAANSESQKVTKTGMVVGTPEYMSPEQLAGDKLDGRSDTYSLALVAFNMMTGRLPFPAETIQESMVMRLTDNPRPLSEMKPDVAWTPEVQAVLDRALARNVADRYQNASEFGRALHDTVAAMPESRLTSAGTAVMGRMSGGATKAIPASGKPATPPQAVPPTRVNPATPATPAASVPAAPAAKSRTGLIAAAIVGIAILGGGGWLVANMGKDANAEGAPPMQSGTTTAPPDLTPVFQRIEPLTNFDRGANTQTARQALALLDSISPLAQSDTDQVHIALLRAESHLVMAYEMTEAAQPAELEVGCRFIKDIEGKASGTRFARRIEVFLRGDPPNGVAPTCP